VAHSRFVIRRAATPTLTMNSPSTAPIAMSSSVPNWPTGITALLATISSANAQWKNPARHPAIAPMRTASGRFCAASETCTARSADLRTASRTSA
jgi:hypothetical protein